MHRVAACTLVAAGLLVGTRAALAGIVVYENGNVIQGPIDPREVTDESVTMNDARIAPGGPKTPGKIVIPRGLIRWVDSQSESLSSDYFEKFSDKYIDAKWARVLVIPAEPEGPIQSPNIRELLGAKSRVTRSWAEGDLSLRAPSNATWTENGNVARFDLGAGSSIHVYSTPAASNVPATQLEWVEAALTELAGPGNYGHDAIARIVDVPGGHDARVTTRTQHGTTTLHALRQVCFREKRTYFVTCFAPEAAFEGLRGTFAQILDSIRVDEGVPIDLTTIEGGQVWRWRSAARADALVWDVRGKSPHTFRYAETIDGEARPGNREAPARVDPRSALVAVTHVPCTPVRTGAEPIVVSGVTLDCEVHEATAEGKAFKIWISKTFPAPVKITVDGVVLRELAEIKK